MRELPKIYWQDVLYWTLALIIALTFSCACLYEIASPWAWGHNGYNGAAFVQAARNSLRFEVIGQAQYYMGLEPPAPSLLYTHHPMLLHAHLALNMALAGASEAAARAVPAAYSLLNLIMIFSLGRRFLGRAEGLIAAAIFAITPINLICANMINHEQGGIFWGLAMLYAYLSWHEHPRRLAAAALLTATTLAAQFDWPAYYLSFFIALHMGYSGAIDLIQNRKKWPRQWSLLIIFSALVLLNFFGFFAWITYTRGSFHEMLEAFDQRSSAPTGYWTQLWVRGQDIHGPHLLALTALWIPWSLVRIFRGRACSGDLAPWMFLIAQTIHSVVFKQAGFIHSYWVYYLSPAIALGGAILLADLWRSLPQRAQTRPAAAWALGLILLAPSAGFAAKQWRWGVTSGHLSYITPYDDQHSAVMVMRWVGAKFKRETTRYLVDPAYHSRIEQLFYLDAPHSITTRTTFSSAERRSQTRTVIIADLCESPQPAALRKLVELHGGEVLDRCNLVISSGGEPGKLASWRTATRPSPWWWWMVSGVHARTEIVPTPAPLTLDDLFGSADLVSAQTEWAGGLGGQLERSRCAPGMPLTALSSQLAEAPRGLFLGALHVHCSASSRTKRWIGSYKHDTLTQTTRCAPGELPIGLHGREEGIIVDVNLLCASPDAAAPRPLPLRVARGRTFSVACPDKAVLVGILARAGSLVDGLSGLCEPHITDREP